MSEITWSCHICKEVRPDEKISVRTTTRKQWDCEFTENVRYCNDRKSCIDLSKDYSFIKGEEIE